MRFLLHTGIWLAVLSCLCSCEESFEVFAPEQEIWVVYGILSPDADTQIIRVSKVFQIEEDAFEFAKTYDPSVRGLRIVLTGNGQTYQAIPRDNVQKDTTSGNFGPTTHIYEIPTVGELALLEGMSYQLEIQSEQDPDLFLTARTSIPPVPKILSPNVMRSPGEKCLPQVPFEDSVFVRFRTNPNFISARAASYEIRVQLTYEKNGIDAIHHFGPTKIFSRSRGCAQDGIDGILCYMLRNGEVVRTLRTAFKDPLADYRYQPEPRCTGQFDPLSRAVELQVTAIDTFLTNYLRANDPFFLELNNVRPEYTNVTGTERALGVFGAISYHNIPVSLTACGEYLVGLRKERPFANCE